MAYPANSRSSKNSLKGHHPIDSIISNIGQHISITEEEREYFISLLERKDLTRKEILLQSGEICQFQSFVISGCLKVFYLDNDGTEHIVKFAIENWWSLDLESFALQTPALYTIQAIEDTELYQISKTGYDKLHKHVPKFEKFTRIMFQNSYIMLQRRLTQNLFSTAEEKYDHFTVKYPGLDQRISQKDIASYLGITPEFLSMIRRRRMKPSVS